MRHTPLTPEQQDDARRLDVAFREWKQRRKDEGLPGSQEALGAEAGPSYSQSAFSQYAKGRIPLNVNALVDFCRVLGVSTESISPTLAAKITRLASSIQGAELPLVGLDEGLFRASTNVKLSGTKTQPGMVFLWDEVIRMFKAGIEDALPEVFSVELTDDSLTGRARRGDVVTLSRRGVDSIQAGDGVLIRTGNDSYMLRIYKPKGDGTWIAEATSPNYLPLHSTDDALVILAVVVGVPSCRWGTM